MSKFYFVLLLFKLFISNDNIYRIPFGLFNQKKIEIDSDIINNILYNRLYLNLSIGTPPQIVPFELDINSQTFSVSNDIFNRNKSLTYEQISKKEAYFSYEDAEKGFNSKDVLNIDKSDNKKINFILCTEYQANKKNKFGILGLRIPKKVQFGVYPFFFSLKQAGIINSYTWTLKYFDNISLIEQFIYNEKKDNIIGEFIFGDEPCNYENDKNKYNEKEFRQVTPLSTKDTIYWDIEFNNIYLYFKENNNNSKIYYTGGKIAEIIINFSFIIGPKYFFDFIENHFFSQYLSDKICSRKIVEFYYYYFECDNVPSFNIESFPEISFEHIGFETTFILTYKDLFVIDKENKKYTFLIITKDYFSDWVLGAAFLRKFQFVFNVDTRTIGYYRAIQNYIDNDDDSLREINNSKTVKTVFIFILIIIFSFLLVCLGMIIQKNYFNKNRKIRANELEENFSYVSKNNNDNNDDKKIIKEDNENNFYNNL